VEKLTESAIRDKLERYLPPRYIALPNCHFNGWEADYLTITSSYFMTEYEIKVSRKDFLGDVKSKPYKHLLLSEGITHYTTGDSSIWTFLTRVKLPNYFYYVVPAGLADRSEVPEYAGLIYIQPESYPTVKEIKKAPRIHGLHLSDIEVLYFMGKFQGKYNYLRYTHYQKDNTYRLKDILLNAVRAGSIDTDAQVEAIISQIREVNNESR